MTTGKAEQGSQEMMRIQNLQGLTASEVEVRRKQGHGNVAPLKTSRSYFQIIRENVFIPVNNFMFILIQAILLVALFLELLLVIDALFSHFILVQSVKMAVVIFGIVPKGLILAISVAYALGSVRIIGKGALVQQANAVLIGAVALVWGLTLRWIWRKRLLERYLQVDWGI